MQKDRDKKNSDLNSLQERKLKGKGDKLKRREKERGDKDLKSFKESKSKSLKSMKTRNKGCRAFCCSSKKMKGRGL